MSTTSRVAGAVAAGYVLGRFKKLRMAVLVASAMSSPKFRNAAAEMIERRIPGGAIVGGLTREFGGKLVGVGKTAATAIVASRIDALSQNLAERSENLRKGSPDGNAPRAGAEKSAEDRGAGEPEDEFEEQEGEEAEPEDEYEEQEDEEAEPEDEYEEQEDEEAEPEDEYDDQEDEEAEPEDEYDDQEDEEAEQPEDQRAQADDTRDEEPEEPIARSPRRRRSASPAGRRRG